MAAERRMLKDEKRSLRLMSEDSASDQSNETRTHALRLAPTLAFGIGKRRRPCRMTRERSDARAVQLELPARRVEHWPVSGTLADWERDLPARDLKFPGGQATVAGSGTSPESRGGSSITTSDLPLGRGRTPLRRPDLPRLSKPPSLTASFRQTGWHAS